MQFKYLWMNIRKSAFGGKLYLFREQSSRGCTGHMDSTTHGKPANYLICHYRSITMDHFIASCNKGNENIARYRQMRHKQIP